MNGARHPVELAIDYPDRALNRLSTALRPFAAIPILILLATVSGGSLDLSRGDEPTTIASAGGLLVLGPLLMIVVRGRYPGGGWTGTSPSCASAPGSPPTSPSSTTAIRRPRTTRPSTSRCRGRTSAPGTSAAGCRS